MEIDVAEIPPLAGFTSKELDAETGLYYGVILPKGGASDTNVHFDVRSLAIR